MAVLRHILEMFNRPERETGDLGQALLQIYTDAGATFHDDFQSVAVITEWIKRTETDSLFTKHLFFIEEAQVDAVLTLFRNLYRKPIVEDDNGVVFSVPGEPRAPVAMILKQGRGKAMVQVVVPKSKQVEELEMKLETNEGESG